MKFSIREIHRARKLLLPLLSISVIYHAALWLWITGSFPCIFYRAKTSLTLFQRSPNDPINDYYDWLQTNFLRYSLHPRTIIYITFLFYLPSSIFNLIRLPLSSRIILDPITSFSSNQKTDPWFLNSNSSKIEREKLGRSGFQEASEPNFQKFNFPFNLRPLRRRFRGAPVTRMALLLERPTSIRARIISRPNNGACFRPGRLNFSAFTVNAISTKGVYSRHGRQLVELARSPVIDRLPRLGLACLGSQGWLILLPARGGGPYWMWCMDNGYTVIYSRYTPGAYT